MTEQEQKEPQKLPNNNKEPFVMDMIHSEEELLHGLRHLMGAGNQSSKLHHPNNDDDDDEDEKEEFNNNDENDEKLLKGHETMIIYRNLRKKYAKGRELPKGVKEGLHCIETFRTPEKGLEAAYRASACRNGPIREASALYVTINPRNVSEGMSLTQANYDKWMEYKVGLTKQIPKGFNKEDFIGTMDNAVKYNILRSQSQKRFDFIDVDDPDPNTWLKRIREAIGDDHIEMILETRGGYHVIYRGKSMKPLEHKRLQAVLDENPGKGPMEKVTKGAGATVSCALPGGMQSYHETKIIFCSCEMMRNKKEGAIEHES